ncbi:hypothetical protein Tcan_15886 [Toxocara canis]|uniref:Uncharacterized protein n=1 Tax=Toxocara canis TaxID=6265 RepID=A0A0B2VQV2_TOXCA|nr:hypothetical protein Tcan_15886 [Toxocara canis]
MRERRWGVKNKNKKVEKRAEDNAIQQLSYKPSPYNKPWARDEYSDFIRLESPYKSSIKDSLPCGLDNSRKTATTTTTSPQWKSNEQQINEVENKSPQKQKTIEQNLKTAEQVAEIKPKDIPKTEKQQQIAKGQLKRGTAEYPTMDDIVSDWDTEATRDKRTRTQTLLDDPPP